MKKYLQLLFSAIILSSSFCKAQDILAGEIRTSHITGYTYKIDVTVYYDSTTFIDRPLTINLGSGTGTVIPGTFVPSNSPIIKKQYTATHTHPGPNSYTISATDSFRVANIQNTSGSPTQLFMLVHKLTINSFTSPANNSPVSANPPIDNYVCCNWSYNSGATDPDGDSLAYKLIIPYGVSNYTFPPASYVNTTGDITFIPASVGKYIFQLEIEEWKKLQINGNYYYIGNTSRSLFFDVLSVLGTGENSIENNVTVYPNPSSGHVTITSLPDKAELELQNMLGESIKTIACHSPEIKVDMQNLPKGIYFLKVQTEDYIFYKKIIRE